MSGVSLDDNHLIKCEMIFGHIVCESRQRREGNKLIGEGRSLHYDGDGKLTKDTGWQPTGVNLILGDVYEIEWFAP